MEVNQVISNVAICQLSLHMHTCSVPVLKIVRDKHGVQVRTLDSLMSPPILSPLSVIITYLPELGSENDVLRRAAELIINCQMIENTASSNSDI